MEPIDSKITKSQNVFSGVSPVLPSAEAVNIFKQAMNSGAQSTETDSSELDAKKLFDQNVVSMCIQQATESLKRGTEEMRKNLEKNS